MMDISPVIDYMVNYYQTNQPYVIAAAVLLAFIFYRSPKLGFGVLIITVILAGVFYLISDLSSMGAYSKQKLIDSSTHEQTGENAPRETAEGDHF